MKNIKIIILIINILILTLFTSCSIFKSDMDKEREYLAFMTDRLNEESLLIEEHQTIINSYYWGDKMCTSLKELTNKQELISKTFNSVKPTLLLVNASSYFNNGMLHMTNAFSLSAEGVCNINATLIEQAGNEISLSGEYMQLGTDEINRLTKMIKEQNQ